MVSSQGGKLLLPFSGHYTHWFVPHIVLPHGPNFFTLPCVLSLFHWWSVWPTGLTLIILYFCCLIGSPVCYILIDCLPLLYSHWFMPLSVGSQFPLADSIPVWLSTTSMPPVALSDMLTCFFSRICVLGTADGWFLRINTRVHIDQIVECFAQHCPQMERLEIQWDPDTIRFSDKSNKFVDHIR